MRLLLIAYEFPPIPSPQSLRWAYLARELARRGHELHVLAPDVPGYGPGGLPALPEGVCVHRCFAGPVMGGLRVWQRKRQAMPRGRGAMDPAADAQWPAAEVPAAHLNWKGRLFEGVNRWLGFVLFPDVRGEWRPWAKWALGKLLAALEPDWVIASHEPAVTLELGLLARQRGFPLLVDLGDPVLAPYTPWRWRRRAWRLEAAVCRLADRVTVTCQAAGELLVRRHGLAAQRCVVLTQGYEEAVEAGGADGTFDGTRLELFYAGSFYAFRRPDALLSAVLDTPGLRLNLASIAVPEAVEAAALQRPERVRLLGFLPHDAVLRLQRQADVLVSIANDAPDQVPGKIYEYLGARRPVLHLSGREADGVSELLATTGHGWCCENEAGAIAQRLRALVEEKTRTGTLTLPGAGRSDIGAYAWSRIAARLEELLEERAASRKYQ